MFRLALAAAAAALTLSACESYDTYGYDYPGSHTYASADMAYYDNFYGPWYDGYWNGDVFYYRLTPSGAYIRDDARHFRRDAYQGYRAYHGRRGYPWR